MAIIRSAKKANRVSARKQVFNIRRKEAVKSTFKAFSKLISEGKKAEAGAMVSELYQAIDKAAKRGVLKSNTASRRKSRVMRMLK